MNNFKGWLEFGVYVPNLVGEKEGEKTYGKANDFLAR